MQSDWMTELYQRCPTLAPKWHKTTARRKKLARKNGERFYQPAQPCHYGHDSPRYTSDGHCVQCRREDYQRRKAR